MANPRNSRRFSSPSLQVFLHLRQQFRPIASRPNAKPQSFGFKFVEGVVKEFLQPGVVAVPIPPKDIRLFAKAPPANDVVQLLRKRPPQRTLLGLKAWMRGVQEKTGQINNCPRVPVGLEAGTAMAIANNIQNKAILRFLRKFYLQCLPQLLSVPSHPKSNLARNAGVVAKKNRSDPMLQRAPEKTLIAAGKQLG